MKSLAAIVALAALTLPAAADTAQQFANKVAISDMFEVESSKLIQEKSTQGAVKDFARKMVEDHTKTSNELRTTAREIKGIELPMRLDADHQKKLDALRTASANQLDQLYKTDQIEAHQTAVKLFEDYAKSGDNAQLKSWAQKVLPDLGHHLEMAQRLPSAPAPTTGSGPAPKR